MDGRISRAEQSRAALKNAFLELLKRKEPEEISVVELCRKAGVNRSTFYAHYGYMDMLIRDVLWGSVKELFVGLENQWTLPLENGGVARSTITAYLHSFLQNSTLRRFCACRNNGNYRDLVIRAHVELTVGETADPIRYYAAYYHNAGILNMILECIGNDFPLPEETMVEIIHEFSKVMYRRGIGESPEERPEGTP